ncbi:putative RiPP precursor [Mesorhizobium sp. YC-39]|nr:MULTISPECIES: putative RiPP precursor [unclassified Mesorhizobium]MCV3209228.1 putative RiPP precursor [Mesorhizobium sp. YC-2]MCV3231422.1 putative RiPP precursor [Mesorhizobium sp. YC-39]
MKKIYEKPMLIKKGKLAAIAAAVVSNEPEPTPQ